MTRHPNARRVHHEQAGPDDAFVARLLELTAWAKSNARVLAVVGAVLIVAASAALYYRNYRSTLHAQATTQLIEVRQTVVSGNRALAIRDLEAFTKRFDGTSAADEARLLLAQLFLLDGQAEKAVSTVQSMAGKIDEPLGVQSAFLLAAAYEASQKADQAEAVYLRIADEAPFAHQQREGLDHAARLRQERGDAAKAAELYQRLVEMSKESTPERAVYELRLAEARAQASSKS